jgi:hypothetical protein
VTAYRTRRLAAALIVAGQLSLIVLAYGEPVKVFGFQMFPESSDWSVQIFRITGDGARIDATAPWPGGYVWADLVAGSGLEAPSGRHPADYGVDASLHFLQGALDWVAANTPSDHETESLVAEVTVWRNGHGPEHLALSSDMREP